MKFFLLFVFGVFISVSSLHAQDGIQTIEYDFISKQISDNMRFVDYNKLLKIRIKNLNPFLYSVKITVDGKLIDIGNPNANLLSGLNQAPFSPSSTNNNNDDSASASNNTIKKILTNEPGTQAIIQAITENKKIDVQNDTTLIIEGENISTLAPLTQTTKDAINQHNNAVGKMPIKPDAIENLEEKFNLQRENLDKYIDYNASIQNAFEYDGKSYEEIEKLLNQNTLTYEKIVFYENAIFAVKEFSDTQDKIKNYPGNESPDVKKRVSEIFSKYNISGIKEDFKKTCKLIDKYNKVRFEPESSTINPDEFDELKVKIEIKKIDNIQFSDPKEIETIELPLKIRGGFKFSFSTGLILTTLFDNQYVAIGDSIKNSSNGYDKVYKVIKADQGNVKLLPAAFTHFFWRFGIPVNIGLTAGIAYSTSNDQLKYLLGGSLIFHNIFGKNISLMLNAGAIYGSVKILTPKIQEENVFKDLPTIETVDKNLIKGFYSISFNF